MPYPRKQVSSDFDFDNDIRKTLDPRLHGNDDIVLSRYLYPTCWINSSQRFISPMDSWSVRSSFKGVTDI
jgi:hypothetical protein